MEMVTGEIRTPSYPTMQSPRYGGCVSAFFQLFEWNPAKRFSSNKRLPASKAEKAFRRSRSFCSDHGSASKSRMMCDVQVRGNGANQRDDVPAAADEDASTRAPGVVARLMGLESLPDGPYQPRHSHRRCQSYSGEEFVAQNIDRDEHRRSTPVLLQDLLKRDFKSSKKTLRDRIPGFARKTQEPFESRFTKRSASALIALRCTSREDSSCISPYAIDIPELQSRFYAQKAKGGKQPFLSRLPPSSQLDTPSESPSTIKAVSQLVGKIPELGLQGSKRHQILQGWPLAGQHNVPRDIYHDDDSPSFLSLESSLQESFKSVGSQPITDSATSQLFVSYSGSKLLPEGGTTTSWNGSEDSETTREEQMDKCARHSRRKPRVGRATSKKATTPVQSQSPPRHRNGRSKSVNSNVGRREAAVGEFKTVRRGSLPKGPRITNVEASINPECSRTSSVISHESSTTSQTSLPAGNAKRSVSSRARGKSAKSGTEGARSAVAKSASSSKPVQLKTDATSTRSKVKEEDEQRVEKNETASRSSSRSGVAPGKPIPIQGNRVPKGIKQNAQQEKAASMSGSRVFPAISPSKAPAPVAQNDLPKSSILRYGRLFGGRKEWDKPKRGGRDVNMRSSSPTLQRFTEKVAMQTTSNTSQGNHGTSTSSEASELPIQAPGNRLKGEKPEEMAVQSSTVTLDDTDATLRLKKKKSQNLKHSRARSVDDVFPELPLDFLPTVVTSAPDEVKTDRGFPSSSLSRSVECMFGQEFSPMEEKSLDFAEYLHDNSALGGLSHSPLVESHELHFSREEYSSGACTLGRISTSPLVDYEELRCSQDVLSTGPLTDCQKLRASRPGSAAYVETEIHTELVDREFFAAGSDSILWEDDIVETILSAPCCERSCSGPSISSRSVSSDVEDERNDAWSSCASYNPADHDSPSRTFESSIVLQLPEIDVELESSPMFVKKTLEGSADATASEADEAGQPSPVSILNSPFLDEACTTSESSLTESLRQFNSEVVDDYQGTGDSDVPSSYHCAVESSSAKSSNAHKIRQALLDISMFRTLEVSSFDFKERTSLGPEDEQSFVREVLSAAHFLCTPGSSPNWFSRDLPMDPSLFDGLESGDIEGLEPPQSSGVVDNWFQTLGGEWRCDRKLRFDCINEAFALTLWHHRCPKVYLQDLHAYIPRPRGQSLVEEVFRKIKEWRKLASFAIDSLIERDMNMHFGNWTNLHPEVAEVGMDIESSLWKSMLEELVIDIGSASKKCQSYVRNHQM
ncbi:uncharacterized protein [Physcomitrium patens]|uniref:uncharacterized protein isoform X2 n=1 Tax=Physcomitrium patens TaxID=3218 RepID=UPI000D1777B9|nr:uncharacterized protein LOC112282841 isoform X2 [Physcomitrium patens]|eukprot:XP_024376686.1 uncharacterized protein LOC112282841 isoform X2 [Physcomitrella patens]